MFQRAEYFHQTQKDKLLKVLNPQTVTIQKLCYLFDFHEMRRISCQLAKHFNFHCIEGVNKIYHAKRIMSILVSHKNEIELIMEIINQTLKDYGKEKNSTKTLKQKLELIPDFEIDLDVDNSSSLDCEIEMKDDEFLQLFENIQVINDDTLFSSITESQDEKRETFNQDITIESQEPIPTCSPCFPDLQTTLITSEMLNQLFSIDKSIKTLIRFRTNERLFGREMRQFMHTSHQFLETIQKHSCSKD